MNPQKSIYTSVMVAIMLAVLVNFAFATIFSPSLAGAIGHVDASKHIVSEDKNNMNFSNTASVLNIINSTSNPYVINNTASSHSSDSSSVSGLDASHQNSSFSSANTQYNDTRHSSHP